MLDEAANATHDMRILTVIYTDIFRQLQQLTTE